MINYKDFKSEQELAYSLEKDQVVEGTFFCDYTPPNMLSDQTYRTKTFKNCIIVGGSFVSCAFWDCTFDNVVFRESDFTGTNFSRCRFVDCLFSDVDSGFLIDKGSIVDGLTFCNDDEKSMPYYVDALKKKVASKDDR